MKWRWIIGLGVIVYLACSCERELAEIGTPGPEEAGPQDGIPVVCALSLETGLETGTDIEPMVRALDITIQTRISGNAKVIVVKKIDTRWIVDTVKTVFLGSWSIEYKEGTTLPPFTLVLRPGTYRVAVFLNYLGTGWNTQLREGTVVENEKDKTVKVPSAWQYWPLNDKEHQPVNGRELLYDEAFAGYTEFTAEKNTNLSSAQPERKQIIPLKRKVGAFRLLLKLNRKVDSLTFGNTAHFMDAYMRPTDGQHFPDGLDVWGNPWYKENQHRDSLYMYISTIQDTLRTSDDSIYFSCLKVGSTYTPIFYLAGKEPISYKLTNFKMTSNSMGPQYFLRDGEEITGTLEINKFSGVSLVNTGVCFSVEEPYYYVTQERDKSGNLVDAAKLFSPFLHWYKK